MSVIPEEVAQHAWRIAGAAMLAAAGASDAVIYREGRWASNAFKRYVRANTEGPIWGSDVLLEERGWDRQPGQGKGQGGGERCVEGRPGQ